MTSRIYYITYMHTWDLINGSVRFFEKTCHSASPQRFLIQYTALWDAKHSSGNVESMNPVTSSHPWGAQHWEGSCLDMKGLEGRRWRLWVVWVDALDYTSEIGALENTGRCASKLGGEWMDWRRIPRPNQKALFRNDPGDLLNTR